MHARRVAWKPALALVALTLAQKLLLLLLPLGGVAPGWVLPEEQHRGNIALELLAGPLLPLQDYHHAPNVGGSLVVGILAVPFVKLLGPTIFALRLVPVLFNAAAVALLFVLLDRFVNRRAAWIGGLLLAVAPPAYALISITAWGTHLENNTLTLACLYLFLASHEDRRTSVRWLFAAGVVAGFATYFGYVFLIALGVMLAFEVNRDKLFVLSRRGLAFCAGYLLGFLPWLTYNLSREFDGLFIYGATIGTRVGSPGSLVSLPAVAATMASELPHAFFFRGLPRPFAGLAEWGLYLALLVLVAAAVVRVRGPIAAAWRALGRRRSEASAVHPALYALAYPFAFVLATAAMGIQFNVLHWSQVEVAHDTRHATPLYPFLVLAAAVGADGLAALGPAARRATLGAIALVLATNVLGTASFSDVSNAGRSLRTPGASTHQLGVFLSWRYRTDLPRLRRIAQGLERRPAEQAHEILYVIGYSLRQSVTAEQSPYDALGRPVPRERYQDALELLRREVAEPFRPYFAQPRPDDPEYGPRDRERYLADWEARRTDAADGDG